MKPIDWTKPIRRPSLKLGTCRFVTELQSSHAARFIVVTKIGDEEYLSYLDEYGRRGPKDPPDVEEESTFEEEQK